MLDIRKLKELIRLMVENELTEIDLKDEKETVSLRREGSQAPVVQVSPTPSAPPAASAPAMASAPAPAPTAPAAAPGPPPTLNPLWSSFRVIGGGKVSSYRR